MWRRCRRPVSLPPEHMKNAGETNMGGTDLLFNNEMYMFHYIESTLLGHIRYKPIIIPNPRDILTVRKSPGNGRI